MRTVLLFARASHPAPTAVVTVLGALLAVAAGHRAATVLVVGLAILTGQLTIGWSNDLLDAGRDRAVGRTDKPLATGELRQRDVLVALGAVLVVCVVGSLALGPWAAGAHLLLLACGWAYNLGLKSTLVSWLPYLVAFGALPAVAWLALEPAVLPPWWLMTVGGLLGVGAHLLNALPDLGDDAATGVHGLPHALGARRAGVLAVVVLLTGTAVTVLGPPEPVPMWAWVVLAATGLLAVVSVGRGGRTPFRAAMLIALANVTLLLSRAG